MGLGSKLTGYSWKQAVKFRGYPHGVGCNFNGWQGGYQYTLATIMILHPGFNLNLEAHST